MNIALLLCDDVRQELQTQFGNYPEIFRQLFKAADIEVELHMFRVIDGVYPENITDYDGFIISGSKFSVNDKLTWIRDLEKFVELLHQQQCLLVGICFGHQLIAKVLGGRVTQANQGWGIGTHRSQVYSHPIWLGEITQHFDLLVSHQDQVNLLPKGAITLAGSEFCPHSLVQFSPFFLGIQGHPEFVPAYSRALIKLRHSSYSLALQEQGLASTKQHLDSIPIAHAIINFIGMQRL